MRAEFSAARTTCTSMGETDVLLLAVADLAQDARTLNLASALRASGLRVECIGLDSFSVGERAITRWRKFRQIVRQSLHNPRVVIAMDLFALSAARDVSKQCGAALLYDMREFYFALGPLANSRVRQFILASHERLLLRSVRGVMVSGELDADIVQRKFALSEKPFVLLNTPPYTPVVESTLRMRLSDQIPAHSAIALYQGVVHHGRGLAPFMQALPLLENVHLVVIGNGPAKHELQQAAHSFKVQHRVHWLEAVPYNELHPLTCGADLGLCLIEPVSMSYEYALPNKLFEYAMAGVPSLVTDLPALSDYARRTGVAEVIPRTLQPQDIASAVNTALSKDKLQYTTQIAEVAQRYSYEAQSERAVAFVNRFLQ